MAFDVSRFRHAMKGRHTHASGMIAPSNYFEVQFIGLPSAIKNKSSLFTNAYNNMRFRCSNAQIPSKSVTSLQTQLTGHATHVPYATHNQPLSLEFIETADLHIREFFETWIDTIENSENKYVAHYYNELVLDKLVLIVFSSCGDRVAEYTFKEVFPQSITVNPLSWDNKNSILTVPVELMYYNWKRTK